MQSDLLSWHEAAEHLAAGDVVVLPTDTLYGIVGSARRPNTVEKIYELRRRELDKPMIVLIAGYADLANLQIQIDERTHDLFNKFWPGPVSVIVSAPSPTLAYLHRGTRSIALRMPAEPKLRELLKTTGPLVAPSANIAGDEPAQTVAEARGYFGNEVYYVDTGRLNNPASALVDGRTDPPHILRPAPGFTLQ